MSAVCCAHGDGRCEVRLACAGRSAEDEGHAVADLLIDRLAVVHDDFLRLSLSIARDDVVANAFVGETLRKTSTLERLLCLLALRTLLIKDLSVACGVLSPGGVRAVSWAVLHFDVEVGFPLDFVGAVRE